MVVKCGDLGRRGLRCGEANVEEGADTIGNVHHIGWCIVWEANHMAGRCACFEFAHHGVIRTSQIFAYHI